MKINNISVNTNKNQFYKKAEKNIQNNNYQSNVSFEGKRDAARVATALATLAFLTNPMPAQASTIQSYNAQRSYTSYDIKSKIDGIDHEQLAQQLFALQEDDGQSIFDEAHIGNMPVTEFYFSDHEGVVVLTPNKGLDTNKEGAVIVTISPAYSEDKTEANTLNEIVYDVYSNALSQYSEENKEAIKNKIIDEIIQANPSLSNFIREELGQEAKSYERIGNLNLHTGKNTADELLDTRLLIMPSKVVYQVQAEEPKNLMFQNTTSVYTPASTTASVIKDSDDLLDDEFSSFSNLIYGSYGYDISDEGYRDIVYAVVNDPNNAVDFEYLLDKMNFNEIIKTESIHDLNRTLDENTDKMLLGISLPTVTTLRTVASNASVNFADKDKIIYQISPAAVVDGQNDLVIELKDNTNSLGLMQRGEIFKATDILQFYQSPDGNGRFANVENGKLKLNDDVEYASQFAINILKQVAYANPDIFASEYESDYGTTHQYGVFDLNPGFNPYGKTLEEVVANSTINDSRLLDFDFVDENCISKFIGKKLHLPKFNYRINTYTAKKVVAKPTQTPEVTPTPTPEVTPTPTPEVTPTPTPEVTPTPTPEVTPTPTPEVTPTPTPEVTPTPTPEVTPTPTPEVTPTPTPEVTPTPTPEVTPTPECDPSPTPEVPEEEEEPSITPGPSVTPSHTPDIATDVPVEEPDFTPEPSATPDIATDVPVEEPEEPVETPSCHDPVEEEPQPEEEPDIPIINVTPEPSEPECDSPSNDDIFEDEEEPETPSSPEETHAPDSETKIPEEETDTPSIDETPVPSEPECDSPSNEDIFVGEEEPETPSKGSETPDIKDEPVVDNTPENNDSSYEEEAPDSKDETVEEDNNSSQDCDSPSYDDVYVEEVEPASAPVVEQKSEPAAEKKSEPVQEQKQETVVEHKSEPVEEKSEVKIANDVQVAEPAPQPKSEPVVEKKSEPVQEQKSEPVAEKKSEPVAEKKSEPVQEQKSEPVAEKKSEPVAEKKSEPVQEQKSEPVAEKKSEPVVEKKSEPVVEQKSEPVAEKKSEPVQEQKSEPVAEKKSEPVVEKKSEPVQEQKSEPVVEHKSEPAPQATEQHVAEPDIATDVNAAEPPVIASNSYKAPKTATAKLTSFIIDALAKNKTDKANKGFSLYA